MPWQFNANRIEDMNYTPEIFGSSIVVLGAFNPAIFSPDWLERNSLIGAQDAEAARAASNMIVSHQVSVFETKWFALQVVENQFVLNSKSALSPAFRDLAIGMLSLVPHTPVTALGLNFMADYRLPDVEQYHRVGDVLAPKGIWNDLFPGENINCGMGNLTIRVAPAGRDKIPDTKNQRQVFVQPSQSLKYGVHFAYNDHRDLTETTSSRETPAERAVSIVANEWETAQADASRIFDGVLKKTLC